MQTTTSKTTATSHSDHIVPATPAVQVRHL